MYLIIGIIAGMAGGLPYFYFLHRSVIRVADGSLTTRQVVLHAMVRFLLLAVILLPLAHWGGTVALLGGAIGFSVARITAIHAVGRKLRRAPRDREQE